MEKAKKVNPLKYSINYMLNLKCQNCQDKTFCKLQEYYKKLENPTIQDLENLTKCLYYKKQEISIKYRNKVS
ncbi:MAG: hypothetical protein SA378_01145 [Sedimentibacter sp.]|uniref:hypothetical protein n=1 Tax=Sedimentibacter sp. TaxID=1960295 RepID=UPI002981A189|nr:hypothetical protein [Sedimentibacter sp.]MDW5298737.1 hypothetical protein [Sedimentibacter sp.]